MTWRSLVVPWVDDGKANKRTLSTNNRLQRTFRYAARR